MKKRIFLTGAALGYVLGAKAGRQRYEQIKGTAQTVAANPKVQEAATKAKDTVAQQAPVVAGTVKDKVASAASTVSDKVHGSDDETPAATPAGTTAPPLS